MLEPEFLLSVLLNEVDCLFEGVLPELDRLFDTDEDHLLCLLCIGIIIVIRLAIQLEVLRLCVTIIFITPLFVLFRLFV